MESDASETAGDSLDLAALVDRAERMVRGPRLDKGRRHEDSDSDYETQNWAASTSEPDMSHLRHAPGPRLRRRHAPGPRDWRHSLPECLEFYRAADTDGDSCADSVDSAALSDLWEHDSLLAETQDTAEHERAELPDSLGNFGEDYSVHLYSDTETDTEEDAEEEEEARVSRSHGLMIASKSALRSALVQASKDAELENLQEVCRINVSILSHEAEQMESKHQIKSVKRVMARWQELQNKIQDRLHQRKELQNISSSIASLASDLDTLDSIILDDDEDDGSLDEDYELVDMRHQLFEQLKSHLLEISDSLFQLNLSLHSVLSQQPPPPSLESGAAEAALRSTYSRWQATHHNLTRAEARHQRDQISRNQTQFEATLTDKLARLAPEVAEEAEEAAPKEGGGWFGRVVRAGLVSGLVLASLLSSSYLWTAARCQHSYHAAVWPLLTFSTSGPRPY